MCCKRECGLKCFKWNVNLFLLFLLTLANTEACVHNLISLRMYHQNQPRFFRSRAAATLRSILTYKNEIHKYFWSVKQGGMSYSIMRIKNIMENDSGLNYWEQQYFFVTLYFSEIWTHFKTMLSFWAR